VFLSSKLFLLSNLHSHIECILRLRSVSCTHSTQLPRAFRSMIFLVPSILPSEEPHMKALRLSASLHHVVDHMSPSDSTITLARTAHIDSFTKSAGPLCLLCRGYEYIEPRFAERKHVFVVARQVNLGSLRLIACPRAVSTTRRYTSTHAQPKLHNTQPSTAKATIKSKIEPPPPKSPVPSKPRSALKPLSPTALISFACPL
jgi:hypothetical protein